MELARNINGIKGGQGRRLQRFLSKTLGTMAREAL
jgi:hypothetical protein